MSDPASRKASSSIGKQSSHRLGGHITLAKMQRLKQWHVSQQAEHSVEYQVWEVVLTLWVMGWIAWLPAYVLDAFWAFPLCLLGILMPRLYVQCRAQAHEKLHIRCDWLDLVREVD